MTTRIVLATLSLATVLAFGCQDRKHVVDGSAPPADGQAGDLTGTPAVEVGGGSAIDLSGGPGLDTGGGGGSEAGGGVRLDTSGMATDGNLIADGGQDVPMSVDTPPDLPQGPEVTTPDLASDPVLPPLDLGPDFPQVPEVGPELGPDLSLGPDLGPDVSPDLAPGGCTIGGTNYQSGASPSGNTCQYCNPATSTTSWATRTVGTACNGAASGQYCTAGGQCQAGCLISGSVYATADVNVANRCLVCNPANSATSWTQLGDGAGCNTGQICYGGSCQAGCWISNGYIGSGATNASNNCQICTPTKTTTDWSNNDAATAVACGTCGGTAACVNKALGTCSKVAQTDWQDNDGDGYGNPYLASQSLCDPVPGWVPNDDDCSDQDSTWYLGRTRCDTLNFNSLLTCGSHGVVATSTCSTGCSGTKCRTFGTAGDPSHVTCSDLQCLTSQGGCYLNAPSVQAAACGTSAAANWYATCDGPNDCPAGQVCCRNMPLQGWGTAENTTCTSSTCPYSGMGGTGELVCDPNSPVCPSGKTCQMAQSYLSIYTCQ